MRWRIPEDEIASGLAEIASRWKEQEVGLLDVVFMLLDRLPATPGGWRTRVGENARWRGEAWLGVERGDERWPHFLHVEVRADAIAIEGAQKGSWLVRTREDFERQRSDIASAVTELHAWCERFVAERRALERFAQVVCTCRPWRVSSPVPSSFGVRDRPTAWIETNRGRLSIAAREGGGVIVDGTAFPESTPFETLVQAVEAKSRATCPLREGHRYRLRCSRGGLDAGSIVVFRESYETREDLFHVFEGTGGRFELAGYENAAESLEWLEDS